jgi:hypothetical protein
MIIPKAFFIAAAVAILIFSMTGISYQQVELLFDENEEEAAEVDEEEAAEVDEEEAAEVDEEEACIDYEAAENTIAINCNASFLDVVRAIEDPEILEELEEEGQYLLNANLQVDDGVTFAMTSNEDGLQYLKIAGVNGIVVQGRIEISGIIITSWDTETDSPVSQTVT